MVNQYRIGKSLGKGSYANVELAVDVGTGTQFVGRCYKCRASGLKPRQSRSSQSLACISRLYRRNIAKTLVCVFDVHREARLSHQTMPASAKPERGPRAVKYQSNPNRRKAMRRRRKKTTMGLQVATMTTKTTTTTTRGIIKGLGVVIRRSTMIPWVSSDERLR